MISVERRRDGSGQQPPALPSQHTTTAKRNHFSCCKTRSDHNLLGQQQRTPQSQVARRRSRGQRGGSVQRPNLPLTRYTPEEDHTIALFEPGRTVPHLEDNEKRHKLQVARRRSRGQRGGPEHQVSPLVPLLLSPSQNPSILLVPTGLTVFHSMLNEEIEQRKRGGSMIVDNVKETGEVSLTKNLEKGHTILLRLLSCGNWERRRDSEA